jgi:hypothetical protein
MITSINGMTFSGLFVTLLMAFQFFGPETTVKTNDFSLSFTEKGQVTGLSDTKTGTNYLVTGQNASLLKVRVKGVWIDPEKASWDKQKQIITLSFQQNKLTAKVRVSEKKSHLRLELLKMQPEGIADAITWGPYPLKISETIGEVVGVVRNGTYAIGIQSLNVKTLGGILKDGEGSENNRGSAAVKQDYGSSLQAYALDRSIERKLDVWSESSPRFPAMPVPPIKGETLEGSAIALFGCPEKSVLQHIGEIELAEGLPHPVIKGVWIKESPETGRAYMISDFNENNVDTLLNWANKAGLSGLYHEGPFKSWGHYIIDSTRFPHGNAGVKACVEKADKLGLRLGVHTLSAFINTNDPYVTPIPDKRLAVTGSADLVNDINADNSVIEVTTNQYFNNTVANALHSFRIGDEIIRYKAVTNQPPYQLTDCQRGTFGTKAAAHRKGEKASMLADYPYEVFFPNFDLQQEIAGNLARFFNETGVSQMDFDGHEGCYSSGQGDYAMQAFADKVFRETKHNLINGTSRSNHYYWHICHYWNWGEPWYGGFRESQSDLRFENQPFLERNYMPNMLGWFLVSATTTPDDIEWMMARAAGYNAGFALVARANGFGKNPNIDKILGLIKLWQDIYRNHLFTPEQRVRLKDPKNDFHLEKDAKGFELYPFTKYSFEYVNQMLQPGQPTYSEWKFVNRDKAQPLFFSIVLAGTIGEISNPRIELDGYFQLDLPGNYKAGYSVVCDGSQVKLYNEKGKFIHNIAISSKIPELSAGNHKLKFDCKFSSDSDLKINIAVKTISKPELIVSE